MTAVRASKVSGGRVRLGRVTQWGKEKRLLHNSVM